MVSEIAVLQIREGRAEAFVEAYEGVANTPADAEGSSGASLRWGVEGPGSFALILEWDPVDVRMALTLEPEFGSFGEAFGPQAFGPHPAGQPEVCHAEAVA